MNRKGESNEFLMSNVVFLIILVLFVIGIVLFIFQQQNGAGIWEDYYVKEVVKVFDLADSGDEICLDVHKATEIAKKNEAGFSEVFEINNIENEVCVKLNEGRKTCFNYFNDIDIVNVELKLAEGKNEEGKDVNILCFDVIDVQRESGGGEVA